VEVAEAVRTTLGDGSVQLLDGKGMIVAEFWFAAAPAAEATEVQVENGLTYHELAETTLLAVVRVSQPLTDYRKQKLAAGVYTLRLAFQPVSDDHNGTAPQPEFCLASPAAADTAPDIIKAKVLYERSVKCNGKHPTVFLLFPVKEAGMAKLVERDDGCRVMEWKQPVRVEGKAAGMNVGLTLFGSSASLGR
jgi:hypothetical protein